MEIEGKGSWTLCHERRSVSIPLSFSLSLSFAGRIERERERIKMTQNLHPRKGLSHDFFPLSFGRKQKERERER